MSARDISCSQRHLEKQNLSSFCLSRSIFLLRLKSHNFSQVVIFAKLCDILICLVLRKFSIMSKNTGLYVNFLWKQLSCTENQKYLEKNFFNSEAERLLIFKCRKLCTAQNERALCWLTPGSLLFDLTSKQVLARPVLAN